MRTTWFRLAALLAVGLFHAIAVPAASSQTTGENPPPRPNIIFLMADDVGWGDFQCYNPEGKIPTPNLDRLSRGGMRFTDAHTPAALCAPTRYAVATGNYTWRGREPGGTWGWNQEPAFLDGQKTVGHILQEAGYKTGLFGKLHYGGVWEPGVDGKPDFTRPMKIGPNQWGYDYSYILLGGQQSPPYAFFENNKIDGDGATVTTLPRGPLNGGIVPGEGPGLPDWDSRQVGPKLVDKTIAFIDSVQAQGKQEGKNIPFYVHLSTDGAHSPYTPPDEIQGVPVKGQSAMTDHTDMVLEVDVVLGRLVKALEDRGLLANTLIVVTSDNGGLPFERDYNHDAVGGLHGRKSLIWEGGHRVPFIAHWGDGTLEGSKIKPDTVRHQVIGTHDIVPTFAELAGVHPGPDQMLDSVSLAPVLLGQRGDDQPVRDSLLIQSSPGRDAFTDVENQTPPANRNAAGAYTENQPAPKKQAANKKQAARKKQTPRLSGLKNMPSHGMAHAVRQGTWKLVLNIEDQPAALYDLATDLAETKNLITDPAQADRVKQLEKIYRDIRASKRSTPPLRH